MLVFFTITSRIPAVPIVLLNCLFLCNSLIVCPPVNFDTAAEANNHIKNLDEELASKYDEAGKHREEITSLLGQLVSQRHKIREVFTPCARIPLTSNLN